MPDFDLDFSDLGGPDSFCFVRRKNRWLEDQHSEVEDIHKLFSNTVMSWILVKEWEELNIWTTGTFGSLFQRLLLFAEESCPGHLLWKMKCWSRSTWSILDLRRGRAESWISKSQKTYTETYWNARNGAGYTTVFLWGDSFSFFWGAVWWCLLLIFQTIERTY